MPIARAILCCLLCLTGACHHRRIVEHPVPSDRLEHIRSLGCGDTVAARRSFAFYSRPRAPQRPALEPQFPDFEALHVATPRYPVTDSTECAATLERVLRRVGSDGWTAHPSPAQYRVTEFSLLRLGEVDVLDVTWRQVPPVDTGAIGTPGRSAVTFFVERAGKRRAAGVQR